MPGKERQEVYEYLKSEGFDLTDERHKQLRALLKANANSLNEELTTQVANLSAKLQQQVSRNAHEIVKYLRKQDPREFARTFKKKHWGVVEYIFTNIIKYLDGLDEQNRKAGRDE